MKKLLFMLLAAAFATTSIYAQQKEEKVIIKKVKKRAPEKTEAEKQVKEEEVTVIVDDNGKTKKSEKKVKVYVNGEDVDMNNAKEKRVTVVVDGDKVTINGKPVEDMNEEEIEMFKDNGEHLKLVAPYLRGNRQFNFKSVPPPPPTFNDEMNIADFDLPKPNRALLGVITEKDDKGAKINNVSKGSAAEKAGLQQDDIITKIDNYDVKNTDDLIDAISKYSANDKVKISYLRNGKEKTAEATLTANKMSKPKVFMWNSEDGDMQGIPPMPPIQGGSMFKKLFNGNNKPKIGLKVQDIDNEKGIKILEIEPETPAAKAGLQQGDIIIGINDVSVNTVDDLQDNLQMIDMGETFKIKFKRNGTEQTTDVRFPKKLKTADL